MLSVDAAHARLAARDPALPELGLLLDPSGSADRLGGPATRSYLRYKPGTSAIALLDVGGRPAIAHHWGPAKGEKRAKALRHLDEGQLLLDDPATGLLVVDALTDRRLPALRTLLRGGRLSGWLTEALGHPVQAGEPVTLSHKPARRWVGRVGVSPGNTLTLRAYPDIGVAARAHDLVLTGVAGRCPVRLPRLLARDDRGLLVLDHLPGRTLGRGIDGTGLHRLGRALGSFHAAGADQALTGRQTRPVDLTDGAPAVAGLFPDLASASGAVEKGASAALRRSAGTIVHGDFSLDQVVGDDGGHLGFIDLDRARGGAPAEDLASLLAHTALDVLVGGGGPGEALGEIERMRRPLLAGHAETWPGTVGDDLAPRTALALLGRSGEPFRVGDPDWVRVTHDLVATTRLLAGDRVPA